MNREPFNIDALPHNADWTKQTLDLFLPGGEGSFMPVDTIERMREWLRLHNMPAEEFKRLPAYTNAVRKQPWLRRL
jgi:hypothetical protein